MSDQITPCQVMTDRAGELICNKPGYEEVIIRNKFGFFVASICYGHKIEFDKFFEDLRKKDIPSGRRRRRTSQSRGRRAA